MSGPLLSVDGLGVSVATQQGWTNIVGDVSFDVPAGEVVALVGESGAGKSVTAMAINGLLPARSTRITGQARFDGRDLLALPAKQRNAIRGREIGMVFQDAMTSLNPAFIVGEQIAEVVREHEGSDRAGAWRRAVEAMDMVGIPAAAQRARSYPHEFSGGMAQRVMIAMAIVCRPRLLIADEPTTALDVTTQARILRLLKEIQRELGMSVLLVTHDLGIVADLCHQVVVMYAGQVVERSPVETVFYTPRHPYTAALIGSMPHQALRRGGELSSIPGIVPAPGRMPAGCRYHPRCAHAVSPQCMSDDVPLLGGLRCVRGGALQLSGVAQ